MYINNSLSLENNQVDSYWPFRAKNVSLKEKKIKNKKDGHQFFKMENKFSFFV